MRDELPQRIMLHVTCHLAHARPVSGGFFASHSEDACVFGADMTMRADRNLAQIRKISSFDQQAANAKHFQAFGNGLWDTGALDDHVRPASVRQFFYELQALGLRRTSRV